MKKMFQVIGIAFLTCFSFYYTDKMVEISKSKDPLMIEIVSKQDDFNTYKMESVIYDDYILSGTKGKVVNVKESYMKMKNLGKYNENLYVYKEDLPNDLIKDNLDKFIIGINTDRQDISLVFRVSDCNNIDKILTILSDNNIKATFFIDGKIIELYPYIVNSIIKQGHYIGNYGYDMKYNDTDLSKTNKILKKYSNYDIRYCYTDEVDYDILNTCKNNKMNTIKPKYVYDNYLYDNIKKDLKKGNIYSLGTNNYIVNELDTMIKYIKQRGYSFKTLEQFFV